MKVTVLYIHDVKFIGDDNNTYREVLVTHGTTVHTIIEQGEIAYSVGDEIEIAPGFLHFGTGLELNRFPSEMAKYGKFSLIDDKTLYATNSETTETRSTYLLAIFDAMNRVGSFILSPVDQNVALYILNDDETNAFTLLRLGALLAAYSWKVGHESAALLHYEETRRRKELQRLGAKGNSRKGRQTRRKIESIALKLVQKDPPLAVNMSKLAVVVHDAEDAPVHSNGKTKLKVDTIRGHLNKMRDDGFFENLT